jgi:hypothetical protein
MHWGENDKKSSGFIIDKNKMFNVDLFKNYTTLSWGDKVIVYFVDILKQLLTITV